MCRGCASRERIIRDLNAEILSAYDLLDAAHKAVRQLAVASSGHWPKASRRQGLAAVSDAPPAAREEKPAPTPKAMLAAQLRLKLEDAA